MELETVRTRLGDLGFSEKEIQIYLTIIEHGEAKASTIAEGADVSKRYVYSVCEDLADRGFVEVYDYETPTTIRAVDPEEAFGQLTSDLTEVASELAKRFESRPTEARQLEVIKSRQTLTKRLRTIVAEADEEVTLSVPEPVLPELEAPLSDAFDRDVAVMLLLGRFDGETGEDLWRDTASVVRVWDRQPPVLVTVDQRFGVVSPVEVLTGRDGDEQAISIVQDQIVPVFAGSFFANYWSVAEEVYVTEPDPLPRTYQAFRNATLQAELHRRAGRTIEATVSVGSPEDGDDRRRITGVVTDIQQSLIDPPTNAFPVQNSLTIETDDGEITVGGRGAFVEDYESNVTVLDFAD